MRDMTAFVSIIWRNYESVLGSHFFGEYHFGNAARITLDSRIEITHEWQKFTLVQTCTSPGDREANTPTRPATTETLRSRESSANNGSASSATQLDQDTWQSSIQ